MRYVLQRAAGYIFGFLLFYEPFMYFGRLWNIFWPQIGFHSIHEPCARIPLARLLTGELMASGEMSLTFVLLLLLTSLLFGPLFCGRLCPAGAFSELLSRLLPERWQLDWPRLVSVLPLRYGFFAGFLLSLWLGLGLPCTYCNYYSLEIFVNLLWSGVLLNNLLSLLATFFLANIVLGLFTKGGRGYCQFLCPVGTFNALCSLAGERLGLWRWRVRSSVCVGCGKCVRDCSMRAIRLNERATIDQGLCISCGQCAHACPKRAIAYGRSK
jgi:polyferredoxin